MTDVVYLIDSSAWSKMRSVKELRDKKSHYLRPGKLVTCAPNLLELAYSAENASPRAYDELMALFGNAAIEIQSFWDTPNTVDSYSRVAYDIQRALFHAGQGRSAGVFDILIAAYAVLGNTDKRVVTVVHYDHDFEAIAAVEPRFHHEWIAPRGTL